MAFHLDKTDCWLDLIPEKSQNLVISIITGRLLIKYYYPHYFAKIK
jgi:hypothetical protein